MNPSLPFTKLSSVALCGIFLLFFIRKPRSSTSKIFERVRRVTGSEEIKFRALSDTSKTGTDPLKVLNLGGGELDNSVPKEHAFHTLLNSRNDIDLVNISQNRHVISHESHCIQSLIGDDFYDVVIMSQAFNLEMLTKRLRERFPDAILIFVQLYRLEDEAVDANNVSAHDLNFKTGWLDWFWGGKKSENDAYYDFLQAIMNQVGGYVYRLPRHPQPNQSISLFDESWHELSIHGNEVIASGIYDMIYQISLKRPVNFQSSIGEWKNGDQCYYWDKSGDFSDLQYNGFFVPKVKSGRSRLVLRREGTISFHNRASISVPIYLTFLTADISAKIEFETRPGGHKFVVNPSRQHFKQPVRQFQVGWAKPGENTIFAKKY